MINIPLWSPLAVLFAGGFVVYAVARFSPRKIDLLAGLTCAFELAALFLTLQLAVQSFRGVVLTWTPSGATHAQLVGEPGAFLIAAFSQGLGAMVALYSGRYMALHRRYEDYYSLLLGLSAGVFGMTMAADLFVLYLFTAILGIMSYVLIAYRRRNLKSLEAGFKYAIMGGMGSVLMLLGIGYLVWAGGDIAFAAPSNLTNWGSIGISLVLAGLGLKAAMVPAHTWLPDAYGRAPSSISAMLSGALSQAYLYVFIKSGLGLGWSADMLGRVLIVMAVLNMIVGNFMALVQTRGKRMLGYSSIAQGGYILLAFGVGLMYGRTELVTAAFFLMVAHAILKSLAFLGTGIFYFYGNATQFDEMDGLYHRMPLTGVCFSLALTGLAGLPPLAGFMAKWQLLSTLPTWDILLVILVIVFLINSLVSLGYYLPPIYRLFKPSHEKRIAVSRWMLVPLGLLTLVAVGLGVFPGALLAVSEHAAVFMLNWGI